MRITKLLTSITLAAVAGACGGLSPTSPTASAPSDDATAVFGTMAADGFIPACRDISDVRMRVLPDTTVKIRVEAAYFKRGTPVKCSVPPVWTGRPTGRLIPTRDPFIVQVIRTAPPTNVQVVAKAPNGVTGSIVVK